MALTFNSTVKEQIEVDGRRLTLYIISEKRRDCRVSVGKTGVRIRVPFYMSKKEKEKNIQELRKWAENQIRKNGARWDDFQRVYSGGDIITLAGKDFTVRISPSKNEEVSGTMTEDAGLGWLNLWIPTSGKKEEIEEATSYVVARMAAKFFKPYVSGRVHELNHMYIGQEIETVRIKHNKSNWGSCSTQKNINLNVRLLFAPPQVLDYVIVHELAHLIEMNHSAAFWKLVSTAMPGYKRCEKWLDKHGDRCVF